MKKRFNEKGRFQCSSTKLWKENTRNLCKNGSYAGDTGTVISMTSFGAKYAVSTCVFQNHLHGGI
jgi:hypothetical protein